MAELLFAMSPATLFAFAAAGILLNLTPGADVMFATASGMRGGARAGLAAALGIALGSAFHVGLTVLGVAAALRAVPQALDAIRWVGAAYLLWLAHAAWTAPADAAETRGAGSFAKAVQRGFVTNLLNPKVGLFILAFLPQFADPAIGPVAPQLALLGTIFVATGLVITGAYGALAGIFGAALRRHQTITNRIAAAVFGGLAARLVLE